MKRTFLICAGLSLVFSATVDAAPGDRWRAWKAAREQGQQTPAVRADQVLAYGKDSLQSLDYWRAEGKRGSAPLVVFVHGGGWSKGSKDTATGRWKAEHYPRQGYNFASIDYRLVPAATVEQQASDVASALAALIGKADELGIDRRRIVLMGHSAGAHLAALVGTDERYLRDAGLSHADLAGVIALDGAGYDVAAQLKDAGPRLTRMYDAAFGSDRTRQDALSPLNHAQSPNAGQFLLLHVDRAASAQQSQNLSNALRRSGTAAQIEAVEGRELMGHLEINRRLGDPDYPATGVVDRWLKRLFGG